MESNFESEVAGISSKAVPPPKPEQRPKPIVGFSPEVSAYIEKTYAVDTPRPLWCVLEAADGEHPRIRVFSVLWEMTKYLHSLEDTETTVLVVHGSPCILTKQVSNQRYLQIDDKNAVLLHKTQRKIVSKAQLGNIQDQQDGWLGSTLYDLDDNLEEPDDDE